MDGDLNDIETTGNEEAEYTLESPVRCPRCGESIEFLRVVRLLRTRSTSPRRFRAEAG